MQVARQHATSCSSGTTFSAAAIVGTAVFRIVVSSVSIKKATATSHGNSRLPATLGKRGLNGIPGQTFFMFLGLRLAASVPDLKSRDYGTGLTASLQ